ncbi:DNA polymerase zeta catalytic [Cyclospora cayetanensis]|uniref:DNA-directed DNA polymerase n=1 Tax=Cyclospora cayetanensis TaxID=88456 RepID=A0A1D3D399_9EIME|nr:DNA polymerase zeta catalytic [Cyclospora cayetanensis]
MDVHHLSGDPLHSPFCGVPQGVQQNWDVPATNVDAEGLAGIAVTASVVEIGSDSPIKGLDPLVSEVCGRPLERVPIVRIYGPWGTGGPQCCLHLHGLFPYFYVPAPPEAYGEGASGFLRRFARCLVLQADFLLASKAGGARHPGCRKGASIRGIGVPKPGDPVGWDGIGKSKGAPKGGPLVYRIEVVRPTPFYGYHRELYAFLKIYLTAPDMVGPLAGLLLQGAVTGSPLQPYEVHLNFQKPYFRTPVLLDPLIAAGVHKGPHSSPLKAHCGGPYYRGHLRISREGEKGPLGHSTVQGVHRHSVLGMLGEGAVRTFTALGWGQLLHQISQVEQASAAATAAPHSATDEQGKAHSSKIENPTGLLCEKILQALPPEGPEGLRLLKEGLRDPQGAPAPELWRTALENIIRRVHEWQERQQDGGKPFPLQGITCQSHLEQKQQEQRRSRDIDYSLLKTWEASELSETSDSDSASIGRSPRYPRACVAPKPPEEDSQVAGEGTPHWQEKVTLDPLMSSKGRPLVHGLCSSQDSVEAARLLVQATPPSQRPPVGIVPPAELPLEATDDLLGIEDLKDEEFSLLLASHGTVTHSDVDNPMRAPGLGEIPDANSVERQVASDESSADSSNSRSPITSKKQEGPRKVFCAFNRKRGSTAEPRYSIGSCAQCRSCMCRCCAPCNKGKQCVSDMEDILQVCDTTKSNTEDHPLLPFLRDNPSRRSSTCEVTSLEGHSKLPDSGLSENRASRFPAKTLQNIRTTAITMRVPPITAVPAALPGAVAAESAGGFDAPTDSSSYAPTVRLEGSSSCDDLSPTQSIGESPCRRQPCSGIAVRSPTANTASAAQAVTGAAEEHAPAAHPHGRPCGTASSSGSSKTSTPVSRRCTVVKGSGSSQSSNSVVSISPPPDACTCINKAVALTKEEMLPFYSDPRDVPAATNPLRATPGGRLQQKLLHCGFVPPPCTCRKHLVALPAAKTWPIVPVGQGECKPELRRLLRQQQRVQQRQQPQEHTGIQQHGGSNWECFVYFQPPPDMAQVYATCPSKVRRKWHRTERQGHYEHLQPPLGQQKQEHLPQCNADAEARCLDAIQAIDKTNGNGKGEALFLQEEQIQEQHDHTRQKANEQHTMPQMQDASIRLEQEIACSSRNPIGSSNKRMSESKLKMQVSTRLDNHGRIVGYVAPVQQEKQQAPSREPANTSQSSNSSSQHERTSQVSLASDVRRAKKGLFAQQTPESKLTDEVPGAFQTASYGTLLALEEPSGPPRWCPPCPENSPGGLQEHIFLGSIDSYFDSRWWRCIVSSEKELLLQFCGLIAAADPSLLLQWEDGGRGLAFLRKRADALGLGQLFRRRCSRRSGERSSRAHATGSNLKPTDSGIKQSRNAYRLMKYLLLPDSPVDHLKHLPRSHLWFLWLLEEPTCESEDIGCAGALPSLGDWCLRAGDCFRRRVSLGLRLVDSCEVLPRTSELARLYGCCLHSALTRGTVGVPLVLEPISGFYFSPVLVLDFLSLYPSIVIANNICYSTCLGSVEQGEHAFYIKSTIEGAKSSVCAQVDPVESETKTLGVLTVHAPPDVFAWVIKAHAEAMATRSSPGSSVWAQRNDAMRVLPGGSIFVSPHVRQGILPAILNDILQTRVMVKQASKRYQGNGQADEALLRKLDYRQFGLKMIANVTYGYTNANVSGRMPCSDVADAIVETAKATLIRAMQLIEQTQKSLYMRVELIGGRCSTRVTCGPIGLLSFSVLMSRWGARVLYGDTDSMFVLLKDRSLEAAFSIGREIADAVTRSNPAPITLQLEKVYLPCCLVTKKRYVGNAYFSPSGPPIFDAKGIETIRRDQCPLTSAILEKSLRLFFETRDLSKVKQMLYRQWSKMLRSQIPIRHYIFHRKAKLGTYRAETGDAPAGTLPPQAKVLYERLYHQRDYNGEASASYGIRVPFVFSHVAGDTDVPFGASGALARGAGVRLVDCATSPDNVYDLLQWFRAMPKPVQRLTAQAAGHTPMRRHQLQRQKGKHFLLKQLGIRSITAEGTRERLVLQKFFAATSCLFCGGRCKELDSELLAASSESAYNTRSSEWHRSACSNVEEPQEIAIRKNFVQQLQNASFGISSSGENEIGDSQTLRTSRRLKEGYAGLTQRERVLVLPPICEGCSNSPALICVWMHQRLNKIERRLAVAADFCRQCAGEAQKQINYGLYSVKCKVSD